MALIGYLQVTRECSQECIFCSNPPNDFKMTIDEGFKSIDDFYSRKYSDIIFTGGEPTLFGHLKELINYAVEKRINPRIITNGQKISDEDYLKSLVDIGLKHVHISLHSYKSDVQSFLTKKKDSLENIDKALINCRKFNITADINTVINRYNSDHLDDTVKWVCQKYPFINHFVWNNLDPEMNRVSNNPDVIPRFIDFELSLNKACNYLKKICKTFRVERVPLCYMADFSEFSTETRKIVKNEERIVFFLDERGKTYQSNFFYKKADCCKICSLNEICAGVYEGGLYYSMDEIYPVFLDKNLIINRIMND